MGAVQGVGFRPFVFRLAKELQLTGWVSNDTQGVLIEIEGSLAQLQKFGVRLKSEKPPRSYIQSIEITTLDPVGYTEFAINASDQTGLPTAIILPDLATCSDCRRELFDPGDRRYLYPFTNCTHCGPRFSIIKALPYDRANTTMRGFQMCPRCQDEYENPNDRRFHAQPNACPDCGPHLTVWDSNGKVLSERHDALLQAVDALKNGLIVAVKGLGGFHLMTDSRKRDAVRRLRRRKHREEKPFAVMFPSLDSVRNVCSLTLGEESLLLSPESPIVLVPRLEDGGSSDFTPDPEVAPGNPYLGVLLPYTPLHYILMSELGFPVVATSGNLSEEPICIDERDALARLGEVADLFLVHDRPIARHVDDSIVRVILGRELVIRRARGYAPLPVMLPREAPPLLAVGSHLKNSVAIAVGRRAFIGQHIGDLETAQACEAFETATADLCSLYEFTPAQIICDCHPDYHSTIWAKKRGSPTREVQHHLAHILSCMAENELEGPVLGVSWDGAGYGLDGTVWGGEFLLINGSDSSDGEALYNRVAHIRPFPLIGGDIAVREPRRSALGMLFQVFGDAAFERMDLPPISAFTREELRILKTSIKHGLNSPQTSSVGRMFDALASLLNLRQVSRFEGQAAMELEFAAEQSSANDGYPLEICEDSQNRGFLIDWESMLKAILEEIKSGKPKQDIARRFHNSLTKNIVAVAHKLGEPKVVLSGGCFQNRYLLENTVLRLKEAGFQPYWHQRVPPNDGGIALGQIYYSCLLDRLQSRSTQP